MRLSQVSRSKFQTVQKDQLLYYLHSSRQSCSIADRTQTLSFLWYSGMKILYHLLFWGKWYFGHVILYPVAPCSWKKDLQFILSVEYVLTRWDQSPEKVNLRCRYLGNECFQVCWLRQLGVTLLKSVEQFWFTAATSLAGFYFFCLCSYYNVIMKCPAGHDLLVFQYSLLGQRLEKMSVLPDYRRTSTFKKCQEAEVQAQV